MSTTLLEVTDAPPAEARAAPARLPSEAVARARAHRLGPVAGSIAVAVLVGLLLGSQGLTAWAEALPVGPLADRVLAIAQAWHDAMTALGLTWLGNVAEAGLVALRGSR